MEGFGLPPLEAMLCGCVVVGFDGGGGSAYLEHKHNALISSYPDLARLIELFHIALTQPSLAAKMVPSGLRTPGSWPTWCPSCARACIAVEDGGAGSLERTRLRL